LLLWEVFWLANVLKKRNAEGGVFFVLKNFSSVALCVFEVETWGATEKKLLLVLEFIFLLN